MRATEIIVIPTFLSLLPATHCFGSTSTTRTLRHRRHHPQQPQRSANIPLRHYPPSTTPAFHFMRLCAATASAGESEAAAGSSSSDVSAASSSSSSLPSTLPSLKILEENQKYFIDNINNNDDDETEYKEWSVMVKKTTDDYYLEKSSAAANDYRNNDSSTSIYDNEWDYESSSGKMEENDISIEVETDDYSIDDAEYIDDSDDDDDIIEMDNAAKLSSNSNDSELPYLANEDDMDDIANMLMECPPALRQELLVQESTGIDVMLPRQQEGEDNNKSSQALRFNEDDNMGDKDCEVRDNLSFLIEEENKSDSSDRDLLFNTESSQASPSRTYSIGEAYKIFKGGGAPINDVNDDIDAVGVANDNDNEDNDNEASNGSPKEYDRRLSEANELIASLRDREITLERELINGKIRLDEALEEKSRAMTEVDELIASLKNQESIMEREKDKLEELLEGKERAAAEYSYAVNKYIDLKDSMSSLVANQTSKLIDSQNTIAIAKVDEEKARGKANLQRLSDEYEGMLSKKSRKIFELRQALRSANDRKRRLQRQLELGTKEIESELRMGKKERERLIAEITLLTESFGDIQTELATNAKMYSDCIDSYEREAAQKDARIRGLEDKLSVANEQISRLESQIAELTSQLDKERIVSANLTAVVSELQSELNAARTNVNGYDDIIAILRRESETYQFQLSAARNDTQLYKQKTTDLEELLSKTKDSLVSEKKRVLGALEAKDKQIAQLDRDLADKINEIRTSEATVEATTKQLKQMTNKFNTEKDRADALDLKIERLNRLTAASEAATTNATSEEVNRLTKLMEEISKSNDEYKSLVSVYDDKVKFLSRQLLLSGQSVSNKQSQIECLRRELIAATSEARVVAEDKSWTSEEILMLRAKLDDVQSKSTMWKAQANGMIIQLTNDLRVKDASMLELQNKLDELIEVKSENDQTSSVRSGAQEMEIAQLKSAMEEIQLKAKERMKQKNQSLKEMEDMVSTLTSELEDLKREKDKLNARLVEENKRSKHEYEIHERQLRQTEDRLSKEHLFAMSEVENEMNRTVHQLEMEIESLKSKVTTRSTTSQQAMTSVESTKYDFLKVQEMEDALRRSKGVEVSLINQNIQLKHTIKYLQQQFQERTSTDEVSLILNKDEDDGRNDNVTEKLLPTYYLERQRPRVIQFVGNAWNKLFRRKM